MKLSSPRRRGTRAAAVTAGIASIALLASCSVANSESEGGGEGGAGDTLRVVLTQEPPTLEACDANLTSTGVVVRSTVTEPLVERNPSTGELEPLLATEWEQTGDTEWTFTVRDDVTFQDGTPFDAEAAAYSIDRAVNGDLGCNVEGYIVGDDDLEVVVADDVALDVAAEVAVHGAIDGVGGCLGIERRAVLEGDVIADGERPLRVAGLLPLGGQQRFELARGGVALDQRLGDRAAHDDAGGGEVGVARLERRGLLREHDTEGVARAALAAAFRLRVGHGARSEQCDRCDSGSDRGCPGASASGGRKLHRVPPGRGRPRPSLAVGPL